MDNNSYEAWIGKTETLTDIAAAGHMQLVAALLDHRTPPWPQTELPPFGQWFYFLPNALQSDIDKDGHPKRGGFLPPITLPRRMWGGSRMKFIKSIPLGAAIERRGTIKAVRSKSGASGEMVFLTVIYEIFADGDHALTEEQDIIYREPPRAPVAASDGTPFATAPCDTLRRVVPDTIQLFRFAALTYNAHRIHYDRDYTTKVEGYPGLIVQGTYTATLLIDHFLRERPGARITALTVRALRPLFDIAPFTLCMRPTAEGAELSALDSTGQIAMAVNITAAAT